MKPFAGFGGFLLMAALASIALPGVARAQTAGGNSFSIDADGNCDVVLGSLAFEIGADGTVTDLAHPLDDAELVELLMDAEGNIYLVITEGSDAIVLEVDPAGNVSVVPAPPADAVPFDLPGALLAELMAEGINSGDGLGGIISNTSGSSDSNASNATSPSAAATAPPPASTPVPTSRTVAAKAVTPATYTFFTPAGENFNQPQGVAVDAQGNYYVADTDNDLITKVTPLGVVTFLGSGWNLPEGVAVDAAGNVYVVDSGNDRICKITPDNQVHVIGSSHAFAFPTGVAVDSSGTVYVADPGNQDIITISPTDVTAIFAGQDQQSGDVDGSTKVALFDNPTGIAVDKAKNVYVADESNSRIRKITARGVVSSLPNSSGSAALNEPTGVAVDAAGNVFVADFASNGIYEITSAGVFTQIGNTSANPFGEFQDGTADEAQFDQPFGLAVDANDNLYIADTDDSAIRFGLLDHPLSYLFTGSFQIGQMIAFSLENPAGTQFLYYSSGGINLDGQDANIVTFSGGGPITVDVAELPIPAGSPTGWLGHQIHQGDSGTMPGMPGSTNVKKLVQMINPFTAVPAKVFGNPAFTITPPTANDSSGQPVVVSIKSGPATMSGNTVTLTGVGTVIMAADQAANSQYNAATEVTTSFLVSKGMAQVNFSNLNVTYDATPQAPTVTTTPSGLVVAVKYGRTATPPTAAGSYAVAVTVTDPNYSGTGAATFVIAKANATVDLTAPNVTFDGKAHPATATTTPPGLPVTFSYNRSATAPIHGGTYNVVATINSPNAQGSNTGTEVIQKAAATVSVISATVPYTGKVVLAKATTVPAKLAVSFLYGGSSPAPSAVGTYGVLGTIGSTDYTGSGNGTLTISPIAPLVVTGAASAIQSTQATLSATITPEDSATTVQFIYGTSKTALTLTSAGSSASAVTGTVISTTTLTNLAPGTTYFYNETATSAGGTKSGAVKSFKTAP